jgi:hypothetical protein
VSYRGDVVVLSPELLGMRDPDMIEKAAQERYVRLFGLITRGVK